MFLNNKQKNPIFFGWKVVAGTVLIQTFVVGFFAYAVSLLISPVRAEFGASLEQVMYSLSGGTLLGIIFAPIGGVMIDRYPARKVVVIALFLFAAGLWACAQATSIWQYIVLFSLTMSITMAFAGMAACSTTVSRWFTSKRGLALGISAAGTSLGGVLVPPILALWLTEFGWQQSLENLALIILFLVIPLVMLSIHGRPSDIGLLPQGIHEKTHLSTNTEKHFSLKHILQCPAYWYIGCSIGLITSAYSSFLANFIPYAEGAGIGTTHASSLIMLLSSCGLIGKIAFGTMADNINLKAGLWIAQGLLIISFIIFSLEPDYIFILFATITMGLASGSILPVWGSMLAKVFGLNSYGRAMGLMGPLITLLVMPSFTVVGYLYDLSGSYQSGLVLFAGVLVIAALLLIPVKLEGSTGF